VVIVHGRAVIALGLALGALTLLMTPCGGNGAPGATPAASPVPNVCGVNPAPNPTNLQPTGFGYRRVESPRPGEAVRSPLVVRGEANPFEGAYSVTVFDAANRQITVRNFSKDNRFLEFTAEVPFAVSSPAPACIWIHESSGRDGSPVNITQVPVLLLP